MASTPETRLAISKRLRGGLATLAVPALLLLVVADLFWPVPIAAGRLPAMTYFSDVLVSHWPSALLIKRAVAEGGGLPLWNPYLVGGRPVAADPLAAAFYPPTHLAHLLPLRDYFLVMMVGHLILAGLGTFVLARRALGLSYWAAVVAAVAFAATPRYIGHLGAGHLTMAQAVAWLPWIALGCRLTVRNPGRWAMALAAALALLLLAGHPQIVYYGLLLAAGLSLVLLAERWRGVGFVAACRSVVGLAAAGAVGVLLAAPHLLPMLEFTPNSSRRFPVRISDTATPLDLLGALAGARIASPVPHEALFEPGLVVLALAVVGVVARPRPGLAILAGVVLVWGVALGVNSPVYALGATLLPDFDHFRGVARIWLLGLLGVALLAGAGANAIAAFGATFARDEGGRGVRLGLALLPPILAFAVALSVVAVSREFANVEEVRPIADPNAVERRASELAGGGRVYGTGRQVRQLSAMELEIEIAHGQDPLLVEPLASFLLRAGGLRVEGYQLAVPPFDASKDTQPSAEMLGLFDVGLVLSDYQLRDPNLVLAGTVDGTALYLNAANRGRAYLVAADADEPPGLEILAEARGIGEPVRVVEWRRERLTLALDAPADSWLVVAMPSYPGWIAVLDGRPAPVASVEGVLPAIRVAPGSHTLVYEYAPTSVRLGLGLAAVGLLLAVAWSVWNRRT